MDHKFESIEEFIKRMANSETVDELVNSKSKEAWEKRDWNWFNEHLYRYVTKQVQQFIGSLQELFTDLGNKGIVDLNSEEASKDPNSHANDFSRVTIIEYFRLMDRIGKLYLVNLDEQRASYSNGGDFGGQKIDYDLAKSTTEIATPDRWGTRYPDAPSTAE